ncbi:MAG: hypothetical protein Q8Q85_01620, partial [Gemmatimonadales bacterium]|nr:hypothetical protein [Gemmatimonadales bacterium]
MIDRTRPSVFNETITRARSDDYSVAVESAVYGRDPQGNWRPWDDSRYPNGVYRWRGSQTPALVSRMQYARATLIYNLARVFMPEFWKETVPNDPRVGSQKDFPKWGRGRTGSSIYQYATNTAPPDPWRFFLNPGGEAVDAPLRCPITRRGNDRYI